MPTSLIKIVAEGAVLESLRQAVDGEPYQPQGLNANDTLIVDVSANTGTAIARTSYRGLQTLDRILANPEEKFGGLVLISFESIEKLVAAKESCSSLELIESQLFPLFRSPFNCLQLQTAASTKLVKEVGEPSAWSGWLVRLQAANRLLQSLNASYRHDHKNLIAAVRIYLGALQAGATDLSNGENVLSVLQSLESSISQFVPSVSPSDILTWCRNYKTIIGRIEETKARGFAETAKYRPGMQLYERQARFSNKLKHEVRGTRVLMLDDHYDSKGWEVVLNALIREGDSLAFSRDWQNTQTLLSAPGEYFDVMLLDCNLGATNSTGLELLPALRSFSLDLPIFMMTAYDNAELALWALRVGCNGFYAKELEDHADRDSMDYFLRFADILRRPVWEREVRTLWNDFRSRLPPDNQNLVEEESRIRYAFYLLFSLADGITWWTSGATRRLSTAGLEESIYRNVVLTLFASWKLHRKLGRGLGKRSRHMKNKITIQDALAALRASVKWFAARTPSKTSFMIGRPTWPQGCRVQREALIQDEDVTTFGQESKLNLGHLERSRRGAVQFVLGFLTLRDVSSEAIESLFSEAPSDVETALELLDQLCEEKAIPRIAGSEKFILIDDEGDINGWKHGLEIVFGRKIEWHRTAEDFLRGRTSLMQHADMVLLDLWLKPSDIPEASPEAGLSALELLKERDIGLPIIIISAATDTVNAIRCMKRGALDYVAKWLPKENNSEEWKLFTRNMLNRLGVGAQLGRSTLRKLWVDLARSLEGGSPLLSTPNILDEISNWTPPRASAEEVLDDIRATFAEHVTPALMVYQNMIVTDLSSGEIPPLDAWRIKDILQVSGSADESIVFFAGRAAEYLGWIRCVIETGRVVTKNEWRQQEGKYRSWIERASSTAAEVWSERGKMRVPPAKRKGWRPDPARTLEKIIAALTEFEQLGAAEAATILNNRTRA